MQSHGVASGGREGLQNVMTGIGEGLRGARQAVDLRFWGLLSREVLTGRRESAKRGGAGRISAEIG